MTGCFFPSPIQIQFSYYHIIRVFTRPSLLQIPSTYAPERLDLLRQLEKVKQMTASDMGSDEEVDEDK